MTGRHRPSLLTPRQMIASTSTILRQLPQQPALQFDLPLDAVDGLERGLRIRALPLRSGIPGMQPWRGIAESGNSLPCLVLLRPGAS